jgi:hypothetical protein
LSLKCASTRQQEKKFFIILLQSLMLSNDKGF